MSSFTWLIVSGVVAVSVTASYLICVIRLTRLRHNLISEIAIAVSAALLAGVAAGFVGTTDLLQFWKDALMTFMFFMFVFGWALADLGWTKQEERKREQNNGG